MSQARQRPSHCKDRPCRNRTGRRRRDRHAGLAIPARPTMTLPPDPKIAFLDRETLAPAIRLRPPTFPHRWEEHQRTAPEQVLDRLRGAGVAVINKVQLREPVLAQLPELRLIAVAATGTD